MVKNSRSAAESVRCKNEVLGFSQLQGRNYSSYCSLAIVVQVVRAWCLCLTWKGHCGRSVFFAVVFIQL